MSKLNVKTIGGKPQPAGGRPATNKWLLWVGFAALIFSTAHLVAKVDFNNWPIWLWRAKIYLRKGPVEAVPEQAETPRWRPPPWGRA